MKLEVVELGTMKVVKVVEVQEPASESKIDKVEMGMLRNMDLERFSVRRQEPKKRKR